jgi:hypothetical protein
MQISREELINELQEEQKLRSYIRRGIKHVIQKQRLEEEQNKKDEQKLRAILRELIKEVQTSDVPDEVPHKNTGINVLENLLKKIIPILEDDYKSLTSNEQQRASFRAHILNAVKNALAPVDAVRGLPSKAAAEEIKEEIDIEVAGDGKFIPVRQTDQEPEEGEEVSDEEKFGLPGEDETGRNFAFQSFNKVENQMLDAYESLAADDDKELFYDYLLTNLKLYFDKFEDELSPSLEEPTTPEYEAEKGNEEETGFEL